ncbi:MAG: RagB/SusD family nutrient uptake outer membrane protein [Bacteroidota bacterium]
MNTLNKLSFLLLLIFAAACTDLDLVPLDQADPNAILSDEDNYEPFLARLYAGLAITGQLGPGCDPCAPDISSIDEGFGNYLRQFFQLQEFPTETSVIGWDDGSIRDLHEQSWTSNNEFVRAMYYRIFFQVSQTNEFLRETTQDRLAERGIRESFWPSVDEFRAEARFLRALSYWHAIDFFGDVIFYTEEDEIGSEPPTERSRAEVFQFIVDELAAIESVLPDPGAQEYGRVDKAAVWMLQAKLFQNAQVYAGRDLNAEAITALEKVLDTESYELEETYQHLFLTDNNLSAEMIWTIPFDGDNTQGFGGMTYLTHAPVGGSMDPADFGINGGWGGIRTTPQMVDLFPGGVNTTDSRALFYTDGQSIDIPEIDVFTNGYGLPKYRNVSSEGVPGVDGRYADTDFPVFRLADAYLMYAESVVRGGGGSRDRAVNLVNALLERAYGTDAQNITDADLTLEFLLDERGRELYWECHRRTDRIRFGEFSDSGVWSWKGGTPEGSTTEPFRDLYPIPASELLANPNLRQNTGY